MEYVILAVVVGVIGFAAYKGLKKNEVISTGGNGGSSPRDTEESPNDGPDKVDGFEVR